jgi:hypothetical protein
VFALLKIEGLNNTKLLVQCLVINGHGTKQHKTYEAYDRSLKICYNKPGKTVGRRAPKSET